MVCNAKPAEYYSSAGVHLGDLWDILCQILDKAQAGAEQVAKLTGKPYDLAVTHDPPQPWVGSCSLRSFSLSFFLNEQTEEPLYNQVLTAGVRAAAGIFTSSYASFFTFILVFLSSPD